MKTKSHQLLTLILCLCAGIPLATGFPVFDGANLANNQISHLATIAKWVESIAQLKTQINQLKQQITIQDDLRNWAGDPKKAASRLTLDILREADLNREYGKTRDVITHTTQSLAVFDTDDNGTFRDADLPDINGGVVRHDPLLYRRFSILNERQDNTRKVIDATRIRERELLEEIALTLGELRTADTDAQVQKLSAKLAVLNAQLSQVENARRREVDEVILQNIANENRREIEQLVAEETRAKDDHLANQRVTTFMRGFNPYKRKS
jgi:hypothetical protein